jgi:hypothetical protein
VFITTPTATTTGRPQDIHPNAHRNAHRNARSAGGDAGQPPVRRRRPLVPTRLLAAGGPLLTAAARAVSRAGARRRSEVRRPANTATTFDKRRSRCICVVSRVKSGHLVLGALGFVAPVALIASLLGMLAGPHSAAAIGGKRAAVLFPFDGGGNTWVSDDGPDIHTTYFSGFGWAEDLHAANGAAVKARFQSSDGAITLKVLAVDDLICTPAAGRYVTLEVKVDGTVAGQMIYEHLNNVPSAIAVNTTISVGDTLGYLNPWDQSSCWADTLDDGLVHTHMEFQRACFRSLTAVTNYGGWTPVGLLSSAYSTTNKSECNSNDITSVMGSASSLIAVLLLSRRRPRRRR